MANIKDFIKKIGNETVSLEEQQRALAAVEQTIVEAKAKREESIGKNVDLVISALKKIESDLETKLIELNNTPAKQGVAGPQGEKGRDGRDGKDGYKGQDGKDGVDGQDGKDGSNGISVTDAKVDFDGSLVITLSDGREIDAGTVVSLDVAKNIHSVQTGGTGSTSQAVLDAIAAIQATIATYGTMAQQNANAVAITGGTIDNATVGATTATTGAFTTLTSTGGAVNGTIGGTTPAAGTFTTITGQTEVLKGTGNNLVLQSQTFENASWSASTVTVTANSIAAPDGTTTSDTLTGGVGTVLKRIFQSITITSGTYTFSVYAKAGTHNFIQLFYGGTGTDYADFNVSTGTAGNVQGTSSITSAGNGWYRCVHTFTANAQTLVAISLVDSNTASRGVSTSTTGDVYLWGAQLEIGSTANTYIPTTTTAIYGTPTLSFSGVAGLGLQSDGSLYVSPAGTGALQAQATTSSATGGNARGSYATDLQRTRNAAGQVASAYGSVLVGGEANTSSGYDGVVIGGATNTSSGLYSFVGGGYFNSGGGSTGGTVVNGYGNNANGFWNFIGNGYTNTGTSASAVTTQSGTMNATTAVTLSGSNANIKVGQLISGTSINNFPHTYVAAISGTSLTLSQNASGSSTSTLSFYTPHGVVVGGGNNQATGSYSFIGGGGDAGTAANRNVASGDWSVVAGGRANSISANSASGTGFHFIGSGDANSITTANAHAVICGGSSNSISASRGFIGGGTGNNASAIQASVLGGTTNTANGLNSSVLGGQLGTTRSISGQHTFAACSAPIASTLGISQSALLILARQTTDATATVLTSDSNAASGTNQVILPNNSAYYFRGEVVSGVTGGGNTKGWFIEGVIKRGANAASTALVGTPTVTSLYANAGASTWTIAVTADTTNGGLTVTFTGQAATTIRTVCQIRTTEMTY